MLDTALTRESRAKALKEMSDDEGVDVLVIGGGVTGAGIALDAATRGLRTAIVEMQDWAQGTSSRSSKLVHGGLRYLYQLNFHLVAESLRERGLLLTKTAPHLVKAQPFLWPLKMPVIERAYSATGIGMYDAMAQAAFPGSVPVQHHHTRKGTKEIFPDINDHKLVGSIEFYDARVDDARLVMTLVRTAQGYGALPASRTQVVGLTKDGTGRVVGATVKDLESGKKLEVKAKHVINATGVWTEANDALSETGGGLEVLASKGVHIVVPRERLNGQAGLFIRTEKSVLFIIPWQHYWIIGTTDTPWKEPVQHPTATKEDVNYILKEANPYLSKPLTHEDIIGVYTGLRPLLQPKVKEGTASTKVSREHTVAEVVPGLTAIAGGKLTSYRKMAEDAVDFTMGTVFAKANPSVTDNTLLAGAEGYEAAQASAGRIATKYGWTLDRVQHLLDRYGSMISDILEIVDEDPAMGEPLKSNDWYIPAEVVYAVTHEGALHLEDIVNHRVRLALETPDRGISALPELADIVAPLLGWDEATKKHEIEAYTKDAQAELDAMKTATDAESASIRNAVPDLIPVEDLPGDVA